MAVPWRWRGEGGGGRAARPDGCWHLGAGGWTLLQPSPAPSPHPRRAGSRRHAREHLCPQRPCHLGAGKDVPVALSCGLPPLCPAQHHGSRAVSASPQASCVILGELLNLSGPQFSYFKEEALPMPQTGNENWLSVTNACVWPEAKSGSGHSAELQSLGLQATLPLAWMPVSPRPQPPSFSSQNSPFVSPPVEGLAGMGTGWRGLGGGPSPNHRPQRSPRGQVGSLAAPTGTVPSCPWSPFTRQHWWILGLEFQSPVQLETKPLSLPSPSPPPTRPSLPISPGDQGRGQPRSQMGQRGLTEVVISVQFTAQG